MKQPCYCGSQRPFSQCCEPYLVGERLAPTAESLMRSRYSAFCQGNIDYLLATHHPDYRLPDDRTGLKRSVKSTRWQNLLVISKQKGQGRDNTGVVEFVAAYQSVGSILSAQPIGQLQQMHERSQFIKKDDQWLYTEGTMLPPYQPKRSEGCWCGSGKKYKQCHG